MFKRAKMNEMDPKTEKQTDTEEFKIPVNDKRRFNEHGESTAENTAAPEEPVQKGPVKSQRETELETQLKAETERREAAEAKLVGVQAKFEEAKASLEKETAEMRTRLIRSLEDKANQSKFNFLQALLPVLDNLNLAISAGEQQASVEDLRSGVSGVARSFEHALAQVGVVPVEAVGTDFDPEAHEAIDMAPVDAELDGKVTSEYQRGYRFGERLLRPAKVQVGKAQ